VGSLSSQSLSGQQLQVDIGVSATEFKVDPCHSTKFISFRFPLHSTSDNELVCSF